MKAGHIYINGYLTKESQRQNSSLMLYIEQEESFIETMTIEEHLLFQVNHFNIIREKNVLFLENKAMLRMSVEVKDDERRLHVQKVIKKLHLTKSTAKTINKLSGGEKKRLSLAKAFLLQPSIILIDEPTSSLDSYLAMSIMKIIQSLAIEHQRTILIVLHQPTSAMFHLIDKICLVVQNGKQAFFGNKNQATQFFANQCHLSSSSLDGFIEQLSAPDYFIDKDDNLNVQQMVAEQYSQSEHMERLEIAVNESIQFYDHLLIEDHSHSNKKTNVFRDLKWLLWRSFLADYRNPIRTTFLLVRILIPALLYSVIYFDISKSNHLIQDVSALHLAIVSLTLNTSTYIVLGTMATNNHIAIKENRQGIYRISIYYLSIIIHDFPTLLLFPVLSNTIIYSAAGICRQWSDYLSFIAITVIGSNIGAAFGQLLSSYSDSIQDVIGTAVPILQTFSIFSGFYFGLDEIPSFLHIISYLSPYHYSYVLLSTIQRAQFNNKSFQSNETFLSEKKQFCDAILNHARVSDFFQNIFATVLLMLSMIILFHVLSLTVISFRAYRRRLIEYARQLYGNRHIN